MTRELREQAIEDNVLYVRGILEAVRARSGWRLPVAVLGFSQGAAMAWRSALLAGHEIAGAIALGGDVPPELGELPESSPFPRVALLARGDADDWYTADRLEADLRLLAARATRVEALTFAGGHEWTDEFRAAAGALLAGLTGVEGSARAAAARRPTPAP
jgi:predicted esterase